MTEPWKLFLDDERPAPEGWTLAKSVEEAQNMVQAKGVPEALSLDHDLSWRPAYPDSEPEGPLVWRLSGSFRRDCIVDPTGLDFAAWFFQHTIAGARLPLGFIYYVHTSNDLARPILRDLMFRITRQEPAGYKDWWAT